jgi:hypothetical protein
MADDDEEDVCAFCGETGCEDSCTGALLAGPDVADDLGARLAHEPDALTLGSCCACGIEGPEVSHVLMLPQKAPIAGHGWGCVVCGLSPDGATAVLCDACLAQEAELIWACRGYAATEGRVGIETLTGEHHHDPAFHPEMEADDGG